MNFGVRKLDSRIVRRYLRDPMFSRFDTIPECDGHTHTHTHRRTDTRRRHIPRLARRRAVMNVTPSVCIQSENLVKIVQNVLLDIPICAQFFGTFLAKIPIVNFEVTGTA